MKIYLVSLCLDYEGSNAPVLATLDKVKAERVKDTLNSELSQYLGGKYIIDELEMEHPYYLDGD